MKAVLDASALLAYLQDEKGAEKVEAVLADACISAVNWAEVIQKVIAANIEIEGLEADLEALGLSIENFTAEQAERAGRLWLQTKKQGLSLGDRACLSLGYQLALPVLTMDKAWAKPKLSVEVVVLR